MVLAQLLSYAGIGALAGFFAGLLGVGGGAIVGPMLILVYTGVLGFSPDYAAHMAVATASAVIVLTAPVSAATHARHQNVNWRLAGQISAAAVCGALAGAHAAALAPAALLKILLLILLLANAVSVLLPRRGGAGVGADTPAPAPRLAAGEVLPVSFGIGALSAVLGIGGGALTIPYLHRRGVFIRHAIGTSAFIGFPLALAATIGYVWAGSRVTGLPDGSWGYVYLPALFGIALSSIAAAWLGARMSNKLPADVLRKVFALMTTLIALRLLWFLLETA